MILKAPKGAFLVSKSGTRSYDGREGRVMNDCYVTFRSLTSAQQAAFEVSKYGIRSALIRTPKSLSSAGCGYALRVDQFFQQRIVKILKDSNIRFEQVVLSDNNGFRQEVRF